MTTDLEDRLRDALRTEAGHARPDPDAWRDVRHTAAARRRRRHALRYPLAGVAAAAAVAVVVVGLASLRTGDHGRSVVAGPTANRPEEIAAIVDARLVVVSSEDGKVARTLAEDVDAGTLAVSPDGETVFFTRVTVDPACEQDGRPHIAKIPIGGGPIETVVDDAALPVVSPDGRWLAHTAGVACDADGTLALTDLRDGSGYTLVAPAEGERVEVFDFSSDSTHVLYRTVSADGANERWYLLGGLPEPDPAQAVEVAAPPGSYAATFLGESGDLAFAHEAEFGSEVVVIDQGTGDFRRLLFSLRDSAVIEMDADPSGRHLAVTSGAFTLLRWSEGDPEAVVLRGGVEVSDAAWVPLPPRSEPPPSQAVAATRDGRVVIVEAATGEEVREVASGVDTTFGPPHVAVSPDGQEVYVPQFTTSECPADQPGTTLRFARFATAGGQPEVIEGDDPEPSPDGRLLAFTRDGVDGTCGRANQLVVRDLATGAEAAWLADPESPEWTAGSLSWAPDSTHLYVEVYEDEDFTSRLLDVTTEGSTLLTAREVPVPQRLGVIGYRGLTNELLAVEVPEGEPQRVVAVDPATGAILRTVLVVDGLVAQADVAVDSSGRHLILAVTPAGEVRSQAPAQVYRWSEGENGPELLGEDLLYAAWLPKGSGDAPTPPPVPTDEPAPPGSLVAVRDDGKVVELMSSGGDARVLGDTGGIDFPEVALSPDGGTVYFDRAVTDVAPGCSPDAFGTGEVVRVARTGGEPELVAAGRWPAVSPDGARLAYVRADSCDAATRLVVRDLTTGAEQVWGIADPGDGGPPPELVGPLHFDGGSRHLVLRVNFEPTTELWYVDTTSPAGVLDGPRVPQTDSENPIVEVRFLGAVGRLAAAEPPGGERPWRVVVLDPAAGPTGEVLVELPEVDPEANVGVLAADTTGRHLLLVTRTVDGSAELARFTTGDDAPKEIADGIVAADW